MRFLRWVTFGWQPCGTCNGTCAASAWGEPWGCWDCRNMGVEPYVRRPWTWSRRLSGMAWKVGPL